MENILQKIDLPKKEVREVIRAIKVATLGQISNESTALYSIQDIADLLNRSYDYTARHIVTMPDFPKPVTVEKGKDGSRKMYKAIEYKQWFERNCRRMA